MIKTYPRIKANVKVIRNIEDREDNMAQPDDKGKLEIAVRILGNELVALKMEVDDFKMKWLVYGVITIVALAWAGGTYGPSIDRYVCSD